MKFRFLAVVLLVGAIFQSARADEVAPDWKGPLPSENGRPFQAIFLHLPSEKPEIVAPGQSRFDAQLDFHNNLLIPTPDGSVVEEDFETQRLKISFRRGLNARLEAGISGQIVARNGGILDGPIRIYHHLLGFGGNDRDNPQGRDSRDEGRSVLRFDDGQGNGINESDAFGLGDTTLWLKTPLSQGKLKSSARLALKIPTGSGREILGSGGFDAGFALDARYPFAKKWALSGNFGASKFGGADVPNARSYGLSAGMGLEWRVGQNHSVLAQFDIATRDVTTGNRFADRAPAIVSVGYKRQINENRQFSVWFNENGDYQNYSIPVLGSIGPDFSLCFGYSWLR